MNLKYLLWVFILILCGACSEMRSNMNVRNQADRLNSALNTYGADLRWGRYNFAYDYHVQRDGTQPQVNLERLENFSVTSFTPINPVLNADGTEAVIPIEIKYYDEQYGTLRTFKETQLWWFNAESKTWNIESDFPALK
jgi:hypothetical protein